MQCPNCKSEKTVKAGFKTTTKGKRQRHQCKDCGRTFYDNKEAK